jgi:hypothetical protein
MEEELRNDPSLISETLRPFKNDIEGIVVEAFAEAGELARRFDPEARAYYDRKRRRTNAPIAHSALAHKLARAAFYIMRDGVPFMTEKAFT